MTLGSSAPLNPQVNVALGSPGSVLGLRKKQSFLLDVPFMRVDNIEEGVQGGKLAHATARVAKVETYVGTSFGTLFFRRHRSVT